MLRRQRQRVRDEIVSRVQPVRWHARVRWRQWRYPNAPPPRCGHPIVMSCEVPREWSEELERYSPRSAAHSYLMFKWEHVLGRKKEGEWRDRSRWVLYQCQPAWAIPAGLRLMLDDAPPRLLPEGRAHARRVFVDDYAHEMYRTERVFVRPFWILQGPNGGVPAGYSQQEAAVLKALGEPTDPPPVGSLPYAGFDWRVVQQILMRDKLLAVGAEAITEEAKLQAEHRNEVADAERAFRSQFIDWFKGTLAPSADFLTWFTRRSEADMVLRQATRAEMRLARTFEDSFIETGHVAA